MKKFFGVIGNPPYQDEKLGENKGFAPPIYDKFMDASFSIGEKVELVHPARFLFNAGTTPKAWNKKMLSDPHLKVLHYEQDGSKLFPTTEIKGGIAITYHDDATLFGPIGVFTAHAELNSIIKKVTSSDSFTPLSEIVITSYAYHFTENMHRDFPNLRYEEDENGNNIGVLSKGHDYDLKSNVLEKLTDVFLIDRPKDGFDYISILGRVGNERAYRFIRRDYVHDVDNLDHYKLFMSKANGTGKFGEVITAPFIGKPGEGSTETFLSLGKFDTENEAKYLLRYIKTRFCRALLGVLKVTQDLTPGKWAYVPLQDFTPQSDIDWSKPIPEIDHQLYTKYSLDADEIEFIETHVKEMS